MKPRTDRAGGARTARNPLVTFYGETEGQIGNLPDPSAAVLSPPYGQGTIGKQRPSDAAKLKRLTETPGTCLYGRDPNGAWFQAVATGYGQSEGNIDLCPDASVTSPPCRSEFARTHNGKKGGKRGTEASEPGAFTNYGTAEGQIEALPDAIDDRPAAAITSPAYESSLASGDPDKRGGLFRDPRRRNDRTLTGEYSAVPSPPHEDTELTSARRFRSHKDHNGRDAAGVPHDRYSGVLSPPYEAQSGGSGEASRAKIPDPGVMDRCGYRTDSHKAITSPPYEGSVATSDPDFLTPGEQQKTVPGKSNLPSNGSAAGQIGTTQGETYADAVAQVYASLARAGVRYLVTVTKNPTRGGRLRRLDKLTARLLRAAGYRIVTWRRAWLWEREEQLDAREGQGSLFDDVPAGQKPKGRLSFFKRIQLKNGGVCAQWEDVFFCELAL